MIPTYKFLLRLLIIFSLVTGKAFGQSEAPDSLKTATVHKLKIAVYPAGGYTPETSFQLGAFGVILIRQTDESLPYHRPSTITPYFLFTLKGQFLSSIKTSLYFKNKSYLNVNLRYFNYPDLFFYHPGGSINTSFESEKYTDEFIKLEAQYAWIIHSHSFAGFSLQLEYDHLRNFKDGGILESGNIIGSKGGKIFGIGPYYRYDTRDNVLSPTKGLFIESTVMLFPRKILNNYSFSSIKIDARYFTTVFSKKNILCLQAYYNFSGGSNVPFYMLPRLGGDTRLRGIMHENLYRDRTATYFQFEGRRELFWRLGGTLFAGLGDVFSKASDFRLNDLKYVYGIGGRFRPFKNEKLNLRMDIGKGPGSQYAFYVAVGEAF